MVLSKRMKEAISLLKQEEFYLWESHWNSWKAYEINRFIRTDTMKALKKRGIVEITYCSSGSRRYAIMSAKLVKEWQ